MTNDPVVDLYDLLPAVHRQRDAREGFPLRAFLRLVSEQVDVLKADMDRLADDPFVETCDDWVLPYIGELVGNQALYPVAQRRRVDIANTIAYRRRKGTHAMLEGLAADVTGWSACVVEAFERLGWTQHRLHPRPASAWFEVRSQERCTRIDGPFDDSTRTVDVRRVAQGEGLYGIRKLLFFLFRLAAQPLVHVPARRSTAVAWGFHWSPLGSPAPLFTPRRDRPATGRVTELDVAAPLRRERFAKDLADALVQARAIAAADPLAALPSETELYRLDDEGVIFVERNGSAVSPFTKTAAGDVVPRIVCARLYDETQPSTWPATQPHGEVIAIDVVSGRLAIGDGWSDPTNTLDVSFHHGFPAELGGGTYERTASLTLAQDGIAPFRVREGATHIHPDDPYPDVGAALAAWAATTPRADAVIQIEDSRTYALPPAIALVNGVSLTIQAENRQRPLLRTDASGLRLDVDPFPATDAARALFQLDGVVVEGSLHVAGDLGGLRIEHATLVPGRALDERGAPAGTLPSIVVDGTSASGETINASLAIELRRSISGAIHAPAHAEKIAAVDGILDALDRIAPNAFAISDGAGGPGPATELEQVTVFGALAARTLHASNSILSGTVAIERIQGGCVRFCWLKPDEPNAVPSRAPRRHRCQPELAAEVAIEEALRTDPQLSPARRDQLTAAAKSRVVPSFTSRSYGAPSYAQLSLRCPPEITTGADDGSEMGAYQLCHQPQREENLRIRLDEYVPFGLEAQILYVT